MLATMALGYADGLPRSLSNRGMAAFTGSRVPMVGRLSMDLLSLDVGAIPASQIKPGDAVEFLGEAMTLDEVAALAGTNAYEILTGLSARLPRHYVDGA